MQGGFETRPYHFTIWAYPVDAVGKGRVACRGGFQTRPLPQPV